MKHKGVFLLLLLFVCGFNSLLFGAYINPYYATSPITQEELDQLIDRGNNGDVKAQLELGHIYDFGKRVQEPDRTKAKQWYTRSADNGSADAMYSLGQLYIEEGDQKKGDQWILKSAALGKDNAITYCYHNGIGGRKNSKKALEWCLNVNKEGNTQTEHIIDSIRERQLQGPRERLESAEATWWFNPLTIMFYLYLIYALFKLIRNTNRKGLFRNAVIEQYSGNAKKAAKLFLRAAKKGHTEAQRNIALCYSKGEGVDQSDEEAVKWFKHSAEGGDVESQFQLGCSYYEGKGLPVDITQAEKWLSLAAQNNHIGANYTLGCIATKEHHNNRLAYKYMLSAAKLSAGAYDKMRYLPEPKITELSSGDEKQIDDIVRRMYNTSIHQCQWRYE